MRLLGLFVAVLCAAVLGTSAAVAKRVALVIGNSAYVAVDALPNPVKDAEAMGAGLSELGFEVIVAKDQDRAGMTEAMGRFLRALDGAEAGLFFYAGHGIQYEGRNYLIGTSAVLENQFALSAEALPLDEVVAAMETMTATNLIFLDACRNNPFVEKLRSALPASRTTLTSSGLAPVKPQQGKDTMIVYATASNNVAADGEGDHSPFTQALLQHMGTPGIEVSLLIKKVIQDVRTATGYDQSPEILSAMATEFYFAEAAPVVATPDISSLPANPENEVELADYKIASARNTLESWRTFLEMHPDGVLTSFARDALITIEGRASVYDPSVPFDEQERQLGLSQGERIGMQTTLAALGYELGTPDGAFGPRSRQAIFGFQVDRGLMPTGYIDAPTRAKLASEDVQAAAARVFQTMPGLTGKAAEEALKLTTNEIINIGLGLASKGMNMDMDPRNLRGLRSGIKQYQFQLGLDPDGYLTADLAMDLVAAGRKHGAGLARNIYPQDLAEGVDPRLAKAVRHFVGHPTKYAYLGNTLYVAVLRGLQFDNALDAVRGSGGHLVVFSSREEKQFVDKLIADDERFFQCNDVDHECYGPIVGYFQEGTAKRGRDGWVTVTGEPAANLTWSKAMNEPNSMDLNKSVGFAMYGDRNAPTTSLMDMNRFQNYGSAFIVEFPLQPVAD